MHKALHPQKPIITVVIPTYNRAVYLDKCLDSLHRQTIDARLFEVIVVNNNCTDNTDSMVRKHMEHNDNFFLEHEKEIGISNAKNKGISCSKGEYLVFFDDDAFAKEDWLEIARNIIIDKHPLVFAGRVRAHHPTPPPSWYNYHIWLKYNTNPSGWYSDLSVAEANTFLHKDFLEHAGKFDPNLGMKGDKLGYHEGTSIIELLYAKNNKLYLSSTLIIYHTIRSIKTDPLQHLHSIYVRGKTALSMKYNAKACATSLIMSTPMIHTNIIYCFQQYMRIISKIVADTYEVSHEAVDGAILAESSSVVWDLGYYIGILEKRKEELARLPFLKSYATVDISPWVTQYRTPLHTILRLLYRCIPHMPLQVLMNFCIIHAMRIAWYIKSIGAQREIFGNKVTVIKKDMELPALPIHTHRDNNRTPPLFSVCVSIKSDAAALSNCLCSLAAQNIDIQYFEVLLIDGGADDNATKIAQWYACVYKHFHYCAQAVSHKGDTRNLSVQFAAGEYMLFISSNICVASAWLTDLHDVIHVHSPQIALGPVYSYFSIKPPTWFPSTSEISMPDAHSDQYVKNTIIQESNVLIQKKIFCKMGGFRMFVVSARGELSSAAGDYALDISRHKNNIYEYKASVFRHAATHTHNPFYHIHQYYVSGYHHYPYMNKNMRNADDQLRGSRRYIPHTSALITGVMQNIDSKDSVYESCTSAGQEHTPAQHILHIASLIARINSTYGYRRRIITRLFLYIMHIIRSRYRYALLLYRKLSQKITNHYVSFARLSQKQLNISRMTIEKQFKSRTGYALCLKNPLTFNEKIQWIKLYDRNPLMTQCADKYAVRAFVQKKLANDMNILNKIYGVWDNVRDIDWNSLPRQYVLKATHSYNANIIVHDNKEINPSKIADTLIQYLGQDHYSRAMEWCYKDIPPRIICERYLENTDKTLIDYKFFCFNGEPRFIQLDLDRSNKHSTVFFNPSWETQNFQMSYPPPPPELYPNIHPPECLQDMLRIARTLSQEFAFVRVDLYNVHGKPIFGEMTFYPGAGYAKFMPQEWDRKLGDLLSLPHRT